MLQMGKKMTNSPKFLKLKHRGKQRDSFLMAKGPQIPAESWVVILWKFVAPCKGGSYI